MWVSDSKNKSCNQFFLVLRVLSSETTIRMFSDINAVKIVTICFGFGMLLAIIWITVMVIRELWFGNTDRSKANDFVDDTDTLNQEHIIEIVFPE
jgi:hypothetical protein